MRSPPSNTTSSSCTSPLKGLKRSYAMRGRDAAAGRSSMPKRPRLYAGLPWAASGEDDLLGDNGGMSWTLPTPDKKDSHIVSPENSSCDEEESSDEEVDLTSNAKYRIGEQISNCNRLRPAAFNIPHRFDNESEVEDDDDVPSCSAVSSASFVAVKRLGAVRFSRNLISGVLEIPSHRSYSCEEKAQIWNSVTTLRKEAKRNRKEWLWEGCSVDKVAEEHQFLEDLDGNLLHPAHFMPESESRSWLDRDLQINL